ncbi:MAG: 30S ribosomal protein S15 [Candidatus Gracilibacteria bacterium]|jgi:small subunit ribosomal protein S15|nr:30S ribosomal protein S15 [Candidatus Gracilibacteria bacterium]
MNRDHKKATIKKHASHDKDTGSSQVQIAILTEKIKHLTEHLKLHPKDDHSRRGLLGMVAQRRKQLNFLKNKNSEQYAKLVQDLGLKY